MWVMELLSLSLVYQAGIPDPPAMSADLIRQKARERHFLEQLLDGKKLENYKIPVPIKAELRKYQQVGVICFPRFQHLTPRSAAFFGSVGSSDVALHPSFLPSFGAVAGWSELALLSEQIQVTRDPV